MTLPDHAPPHDGLPASGDRRGESRRDVASVLPPFLRAHRRAALLTFLLVLMIGVAIAAILPRRFVASTDLWLDRGRSANGVVAPDDEAARLARNTELRLLTSRDLAARAVTALGLDRVLGLGLGQASNGAIVDGPAAQREAIRAVQERLSVDSAGDSYAVRIRFRADTPTVAASVANRIADLYVDDRQRGGARGQRRQRLASALATARDAVVRSDAAVEAYRSATLLAVGGGRQVDLQSDIAALNVELAVVRASAEDARASAAKATAAAAQRLRDLERRRAQRAIEDQTGSDAIDGQIAIQRSRLDRLVAQASAVDARVTLLSRVRERAGRAAAEARRVDAELARLVSVAAAAKARYAQVAAAVSRESAVEARQRSTAYVISRASVQNVRREPGWWLIALIVLAGAAAAAALVALALDLRHKGFRTSAALERAVGTRVLAMVPQLSGLRRTTAADDRLAVPDYLMRDPASSFADVFRDLLAVLRAEVVREGPMVVSVSSALPDEGKTTIALCLARSAARDGDRTLLIDCDVRRPAASRALFQALPIGLVEVVRDEIDPLDALHRDPGSDAMVLGIATGQHDRSVSLDPKAVGSLIERLKQDFDIIICDTPPALALSEARETAALADAALLVVRHMATPKGAVTIAHDMLTSAGARIAGAVMTMVRV